jgi:alcohol dehydrogenase
MKALVYRGPGKRAWEDVPKPELMAETDIILKVSQTTLCGTDYAILKGEIRNVPDGLILGHEGMGTIEEAGSDVSLFKIGDKAMVSYTPTCGKSEPHTRELYSAWDHGGWDLGCFIDGTMAEYARIPHADENLQHVPDGVDEESLMMLLDILPNGFEYSMPDGQIKPGDTVVIFGSGHLGLTALLLAQFHSPAEIIMVDTHRQCFEAAMDLGATRIIHAENGDAMKEITRASNGKKVDVAIVANAKVAVNSIWRSYGQPSLPLNRVLLMPSRQMCG